MTGAEEPISWRIVRKNAARIAHLAERVAVLEGKVEALRATAATPAPTPDPTPPVVPPIQLPPTNPPDDTPGKGKGKPK